MLKLLNKLKQIFQKEETISNEKVKIENLSQWFNQKTTQLELKTEITQYFKNLNSLKLELQQKINDLQEEQVSEKDKQQVEARVRNIVGGHKENYLREVQRFEENLHPLNIDNFTTETLQKTLDFNENLDQEIDNLAKRTAKSYQAAQHLFFEKVEEIFKVIGELNLLTKKFQEQQQKIKTILEINKLIVKLEHTQDKKQQIETEKVNKNKSLHKLEEKLEEEQTNQEKLNQSKEFSIYNELKNSLEDYQKTIRELEDQIYFFFSKLSKPLKKYKRIAINNKRITKYLEDSIRSFYQDKELKIIGDLTKLKESLQNRSVNFDKKQTGKFIELIDMAENSYLKKIEDKINSNKQEIDRIKNNLSEEIIEKIKKQEQEIKLTRDKIKNIEKELSHLNKSAEFNNDRTKEELMFSVKKIFNLELEIN